MTHNPFPLISSEIKYKNPWISVREDRVYRPDGNPGIFWVVTVNDGSIILAVDSDNCVYLNHEYHYALGKYEYKLFWWARDGDEKPLECAARELSEESGIEAKKWTFLGELHPYTNIVQWTEYLYLAQDLNYFSPHPEAWETTKAKKFHLSEVFKMVDNGHITHAASVVAILRAKDILSPKHTS